MIIFCPVPELITQVPNTSQTRYVWVTNEGIQEVHRLPHVLCQEDVKDTLKISWRHLAVGTTLALRIPVPFLF